MFRPRVTVTVTRHWTSHTQDRRGGGSSALPFQNHFAVQLPNSEQVLLRVLTPNESTTDRNLPLPIVTLSHSSHHVPHIQNIINFKIQTNALRRSRETAQRAMEEATVEAIARCWRRRQALLLCDCVAVGFDAGRQPRYIGLIKTSHSSNTRHRTIASTNFAFSALWVDLAAFFIKPSFHAPTSVTICR